MKKTQSDRLEAGTFVLEMLQLLLEKIKKLDNFIVSLVLQ